MFFLPAIVTQAVGSEDDRAFIHRLYQNYANFLFFQARKYDVPMMNAEDIVQVTMLRVIENLEKYRSLPCNTWPALFVSIIRSIAIDALRKSGHEILTSENDLLENTEKAEQVLQNVEERLNRETEYQELRDALNRLDHKELDILRSKYLLEESDATIGKRYGLKAASVRVYLMRIRCKLRKMMEEGRNNGQD